MIRLFQRLSIATVVTVLTSSLAQSQTNAYVPQNLVSDLAGFAPTTDPNLRNPWGLALSPNGTVWVSNQRTGTSTLYDKQGHPGPFTVQIPPSASGSGTGSPTGVVFNSSTDFQLQPGQPALFIFATTDGTISGWNPNVNQTQAVLNVDNSGSGAAYTGLAIGTDGSSNFLYAANFHGRVIEIFNGNFERTFPGTFFDPLVPSGFSPFNIQNIQGRLYVTYAKVNDAGTADQPGPGNGYVAVFDVYGNLQQHLISNGPLNSPWGVTIAPTSFGMLSGSLLVGNFGDGKINAFDPSSGASLGTMSDASGNPITILGLWSLVSTTDAASNPIVLFTAGFPATGQLEDHGLFGMLSPQAQ
jgi:uncharacterized protein (TIGR03118 family)